MHRSVLALLIVACCAASIGAAECTLTLEPLVREVPRYGKMEMVVHAGDLPGDPFNPAEIDLSVEFTAPSGRKILLPAFFYQHHERQRLPQARRQAEWLYPVGTPTWRVRFAPEEVGQYSAVAILKRQNREIRSEAIAFASRPSDSKGFIRISKRNPRYMEHSDGTPFFAVGQNVAFVTDSYATCEKIEKLGRNGANFARVWACAEDWAMAIESRKSAWSRSWAWKPPYTHLPGEDAPAPLHVRLSGDAGATVTANPSNPVALRPGTRYRFTASFLADAGVSMTIGLGGTQRVEGSGEWKEIRIEFVAGAEQWRLAPIPFHLASKGDAYLRNLSLREAGGGPELLGEADPNRPILGLYHQTDCFMLDRIIDAAEQAGVKLQVVLLTRNLYMPDIGKDPAAYDAAIASAKKLLRYAVARWGYSTSIALWEYFNEMDPGRPTDRFYEELGAELERIDPYRHLRCTSAWHSPAPRDYRHPRIDTADVHYYIRPVTKELYKDEVASVLERWKTCSAHVQNRPLLFSEFGITDDKWNRSADLDKDTQFTHLHNALWASALGGFASTVCHWYWDDIHRRDLYPLYRGISHFTAGVPWTSADLRPADVKPSPAIRIVGLQDKAGAYLWINDPQATWWNIAVDSKSPQAVEGAWLTLEGLAPGSYQVEWWDTVEGTVTAKQPLAVEAQPVRVQVPAFKRDIACHIVR